MPHDRHTSSEVRDRPALNCKELILIALFIFMILMMRYAILMLFIRGVRDSHDNFNKQTKELLQTNNQTNESSSSSQIDELSFQINKLSTYVETLATRIDDLYANQWQLREDLSNEAIKHKLAISDRFVGIRNDISRIATESQQSLDEATTKLAAAIADVARNASIIRLPEYYFGQIPQSHLPTLATLNVIYDYHRKSRSEHYWIRRDCAERVMRELKMI